MKRLGALFVVATAAIAVVAPTHAVVAASSTDTARYVVEFTAGTDVDRAVADQLLARGMEVDDVYRSALPGAAVRATSDEIAELRRRRRRCRPRRSRSSLHARCQRVGDAGTGRRVESAVGPRPHRSTFAAVVEHLQLHRRGQLASLPTSSTLASISATSTSAGAPGSATPTPPTPHGSRRLQRPRHPRRRNRWQHDVRRRQERVVGRRARASTVRLDQHPAAHRCARLGDRRSPGRTRRPW